MAATLIDLVAKFKLVKTEEVDPEGMGNEIEEGNGEISL
jgi:hypothetical protein